MAEMDVCGEIEGERLYIDRTKNTDLTKGDYEVALVSAAVEVANEPTEHYDIYITCNLEAAELANFTYEVRIPNSIRSVEDFMSFFHHVSAIYSYSRGNSYTWDLYFEELFIIERLTDTKVRMSYKDPAWYTGGCDAFFDFDQNPHLFRQRNQLFRLEFARRELIIDIEDIMDPPSHVDIYLPELVENEYLNDNHLTTVGIGRSEEGLNGRKMNMMVYTPIKRLYKSTQRRIIPPFTRVEFKTSSKRNITPYHVHRCFIHLRLKKK